MLSMAQYFIAGQSKEILPKFWVVTHHFPFWLQQKELYVGLLLGGLNLDVSQSLQWPEYISAQCGILSSNIYICP